MKFYIRYSKRISEDLERGCSYHYTGMGKDFSIEDVACGCGVNESELEYLEWCDQYAQVLNGICAFELEAENVEDAIEEAKEFRFNDVYNSKDMPFFNVLTGDYVDSNVEGCLIENAELVYSNN